MWFPCPERPIGEDTPLSFMWSCHGKRSGICKINRDKNPNQYGRNYRNLRPSRTFKQKADAAGRASPLGLRSSQSVCLNLIILPRRESQIYPGIKPRAKPARSPLVSQKFQWPLTRTTGALLFSYRSEGSVLAHILYLSLCP